jgi:hypothetical protein
MREQISEGPLKDSSHSAPAVDCLCRRRNTGPIQLLHKGIRFRRWEAGRVKAAFCHSAMLFSILFLMVLLDRATAGACPQNANGKFDTRLFDIPAESYGFSNNARGLSGPPAYGKVRFALGSSPVRIHIKIK